MTEIYRIIDEYDNYSVSTLGNVKNNKTGRIMKGTKNTNGYLIVGLRKNGIRETHHVHRLVALAFIPNPENKMCVDHVFNDKTDNRAEVLRWCTKSENGMNQQLRTNSKSGCKGVTWVESRQKWHARITIDGIQIHLGYFDSKEEASEARQTRANAAFGIFTNACETLQNSSANLNASSPCDLVANE